MDVRDQILELAGERYRLQVCKAKDEKRCKEIDAQMIELMLGEGEEKIQFDDYNATIVSASNSNISREALILAGVDGKIVDACTKKTPYSFMKITERKHGAQGDVE